MYLPKKKQKKKKTFHTDKLCLTHVGDYFMIIIEPYSLTCIYLNIYTFILEIQNLMGRMIPLYKVD